MRNKRSTKNLENTRIFGLAAREIVGILEFLLPLRSAQSFISRVTSLLLTKDNNTYSRAKTPKMPHYYFDWYYDDLPEKAVKVR